jgi:Ca2+-binding EF-hand superfamily protein
MLDLTPDEQAGVYQLLSEYRQAIKVKRISMKPQFQGFDITKNGHVTKTQFVRVCNQLGVVAPDFLMNILLRRYMDKGNVEEVNYVDFCNDVDTPQDIFGVGRDYNHSNDYFPRSTPHPVATDIIRDSPEDVEDILAKLRLQAKEQRIRFSEFMRDFDKLRSGYITDSQFRIGLNMGKVVLSQAEFNALSEHFKAPKEGKHVKWREFCDSVDTIFTKKGLEKNVDIPLDDARTQTNYGFIGANSEQRDLAQQVAENFRDLLIKNRLDAKSFFQDWDRHKHFKISLKQFRQVLSNFGFIISDEEAFACQRVFGNPAGEIEYLKFLADCDPSKVGPQAIDRAAKSQYIGKETDFTGTSELNKLMVKIKNQIKKDRIRLLEFF